MATFPREFKKILKGKIKDLRDQSEILMSSTRKLKNSKTQDASNEIFYDHFIRKNEREQEKIVMEIKRLQWLLKPNTDTQHLNIERAKAFPIPQIIEVNRKKAKCPWHDDHKPSMQYSPSRNSVYCFVCNRGGDAIDVAQVVWNLTFKEAVIRLTT